MAQKLIGSRSFAASDKKIMARRADRGDKVEAEGSWEASRSSDAVSTKAFVRILRA